MFGVNVVIMNVLSICEGLEKV